MKNEALRAWRARAGLSTAGLARHVGVDQSLIVHLEAGRKMPSADLLARLVKELGAPYPLALGYTIVMKPFVVRHDVEVIPANTPKRGAQP
jgi:transcriptional regulator with XRE-family HTH domain